MWVLLIEDEEDLCRSLKHGLEEEGYTVDLAHDGQQGELMATTNDYDLLIVDWRLPRLDGITVVKHLRARGKTYPILMLTALGDVDHRVTGLDAGADDYLAKPFSFEELLARLRSLLRRVSRTLHDAQMQVGPVQMNTTRRQVTVQGKRVLLRPKEYALLEVFMHQPEHVLSRSVIAERVWGTAFYTTDHVLDVTISTLRRKLLEAQAQQQKTDAETDQHHVTIETIRGVGYRLMVQ